MIFVLIRHKSVAILLNGSLAFCSVLGLRLVLMFRGNILYKTYCLQNLNDRRDDERNCNHNAKCLNF